MVVLPPLPEAALPVVARSPFVANSGHGDQFTSVRELVRTVQQGLHLNEHAIPSLGRIATPCGHGPDDLALNAYLLDFYTHGQVKALATEAKQNAEDTKEEEADSGYETFGTSEMDGKRQLSKGRSMRLWMVLQGSLKKNSKRCGLESTRAMV